MANVSIDDDPKNAVKGRLYVRLSLKVSRNFDSASILDELSQKIHVIMFKEL